EQCRRQRLAARPLGLGPTAREPRPASTTGAVSERDVRPPGGPGERGRTQKSARSGNLSPEFSEAVVPLDRDAGEAEGLRDTREGGGRGAGGLVARLTRKARDTLVVIAGRIRDRRARLPQHLGDVTTRLTKLVREPLVVQCRQQRMVDRV